MTKRLLFVSPRFLFPVDSGGKIRTTQILRGLKGGAYEVTLVSPTTEAQRADHAAAIASVCDHFAPWPITSRGRWAKLHAAAAVLDRLPIPVATDRSEDGSRAVQAALERFPDVVVFDFPHAAVLAPERLKTPSVLFTHNIEAEIFKRHADVASFPMSALWKSQLRKMSRFERETLRRFDTVIAVSERDADVFVREYETRNVRTISTGVDLGYFNYAGPADGGDVVFTGSMDWLANRDGINFLMDSIWPRVTEHAPQARMVVVGRSPPVWLTRKAEQAKLNWHFTGYVDDVRPYVTAGSVYVIPLRVGGGTRLKVYEAMAMGCPVVSTSIGVEGLPLIADTHYLRADDEATFARAIVRLLLEAGIRKELSLAARQFVDTNCSFRAVARQFEQICSDTVARHSPRPRVTRLASSPDAFLGRES